jgi:hypothetical protein
MEYSRLGENSPPKLGGVAASDSEQTGWFQSRMLQEFGMGTTPPRFARHPS